MAPAAAGYFRRLTRRLTEDVEQLDAEEMTESIEAAGGSKACDCRRGDEVTMVGRLRSVDACPKSGNASFEAEFFDGTEVVNLIWIGRRRIPGIETGRSLLIRGRVGERGGRKAIFNPYYELRGE